MIQNSLISAVRKVCWKLQKGMYKLFEKNILVFSYISFNSASYLERSK